MYNVLIVDDEINVCEGLSIIIEWENYGFRVIDTAQDGEEALERLQNSRYNLVITDIRMPVLDGLDLIKAIRGLNPDIKILIISGYSDFSYAKQAIEFGVRGYLLKPIDREDLTDNIVKIREELDLELEKRKFLRDSMNIAIDKLLFDFAGGNISEGTFFEKMAHNGINIENNCFNIALLEIEGFFDVVGRDLEEANLIKFGVRNIVEEIMNECGYGAVYEDTSGTLGILLYGGRYEADRKSVHAVFEKINSSIENFLKLITYIGYGNEVKNAAQVKECRDQALFALERRIISEDSRVIPYSKVAGFENLVWNMQWDCQNLVYAIEEYDTDKIDNEVAYLISEIAQKALTKDTVQVIIYNTIFALCSLVRKLNGDPGKIFDSREIFTLRSGNQSTVQLKEWLLAKCYGTCDYLAGIQKGKSSNIADQIKKYINSNYSEDLSLKSIAGIFYSNTAYLGRIFKNAVGESFNDYLNKIRISEAKRLISVGDGRIYEIIARVGYNNPEHFYRQFKRYEGIPFPEYKEKHRKTSFNHISGG